MKLCICKAENINLVEIDLHVVVSEIWKAEFGDFTLPVNNTFVCHAFFVFLIANT